MRPAGLADVRCKPRAELTTRTASIAVLICAGLFAACVGSGADAPTGPAATLAACPASLAEPLFNTMPMDVADFITFRPLGWLSPPIHMFPAKHSAFAMALPGQASPKKPFKAPAQVWVAEVWAASFSTGGSDYQIFFYPCKEFRVYIGHITTISAKLVAAIATNTPTCNSFNEGTAVVTTCRHVGLSVSFAAGEQIGIGTDAAGIDFGAVDNRAPPAGFANIAHYSFDYPYYVSPVRYFTPAVRAIFDAHTGSVFGTRLRTAAPVEGIYMQDVPGTAQGNWFRPGISYANNTDMSSALGLVHDYIDPTEPIVSMGTSVAGLAMGLYAFTPQGGSGTLNRDFSAVVPDGRIYCFDAFKTGTSAGGVGLAAPHGIVLVSLPTATTLKIERQGADGSKCDATTTYLFTAGATGFER